MKHTLKLWVATLALVAFCVGMFSVSVNAEETAGQRFAYGLAQYEQEITLEFATTEEAEGATVEKLEMPIGKTLAISGRWDDTNGAHFQMSETMKKNGWKGSFYLNKCDENYAKNIVSQFKKDGNSIGVHTLRHPHLETVVPNRVFEEIMGNRVDLETKTDMTATTFTFPYGLGKDTPESLTTAVQQGEMIIRSGLLGGPETINMARRLGVKPEQFVSPHRFNANDRDPNLETFQKGWDSGLKQIGEGWSSCGPYMALGTHSWQTSVHKDGFERLSKILATQANRADVWYCNSNEYTTYRLNFVQARVEKVKVDGKCATFRIYRFEPQATGAVVDMGLKAIPTPKKVACACGKNLNVTETGEFMLPNVANQVLPTKIDRIDNPTNNVLDAEAFTCGEFPGLKIASRVNLEKNVLEMEIRNDTEKTLKNVKGHVRLPLKWKGETPCWYIPEVTPSGAVKMEITLGEVDSAENLKTYALFIDNQVDFQLGDERGRIHSTVTIEQL